MFQKFELISFYISHGYLLILGDVLLYCIFSSFFKVRDRSKITQDIIKIIQVKDTDLSDS